MESGHGVEGRVGKEGVPKDRRRGSVVMAGEAECARHDRCSIVTDWVVCSHVLAYEHK